MQILASVTACARNAGAPCDTWVPRPRWRRKRSLPGRLARLSPSVRVLEQAPEKDCQTGDGGEWQGESEPGFEPEEETGFEPGGRCRFLVRRRVGGKWGVGAEELFGAGEIELGLLDDAEGAGEFTAEVVFAPGLGVEPAQRFKVGAKGGGRPDMARAGGGDNPDGLPAALASVPDWVRGHLGG